MKTAISKHGQSQFVLTLNPENPKEVDLLKEMSEFAEQNTCLFICRGVEYMKPEVEFLVQKSSTGRD